MNERTFGCQTYWNKSIRIIDMSWLGKVRLARIFISRQIGRRPNVIDLGIWKNYLKIGRDVRHKVLANILIVPEKTVLGKSPIPNFRAFRCSRALSRSFLCQIRPFKLYYYEYQVFSWKNTSCGLWHLLFTGSQIPKAV